MGASALLACSEQNDFVASASNDEMVNQLDLECTTYSVCNQGRGAAAAPAKKASPFSGPARKSGSGLDHDDDHSLNRSLDANDFDYVEDANDPEF